MHNLRLLMKSKASAYFERRLAESIMQPLKLDQYKDKRKAYRDYVRTIR